METTKQKPAAYVKMRAISGIPFRIEKSYNMYRSGGLEVAGKFVGKTFVEFPKVLDMDVFVNGRDSVPDELKAPGTPMEWREKVWNKEQKQFEFHRIHGKIPDFYKTYKKVVDVEVTLGADAEFEAWDSVAKEKGVKKFPKGTLVCLEAVPTGRLGKMLEALDLDTDVQLVDGKDKAGNPAKVRPFDWELGIKERLEGKFLKVRVTGEAMDTSYLFKEVPPFDSEPEAKKRTPVIEEEIDIEDVPF